MPNRGPQRLTIAAWSLGFVLFYVALDWASYISPLRQLNVTPWNPAPALGLLYVIRRGRVAAAMLFVAIIASDFLVRATPGNLPVTLGLGAMLSLSYVGIATALKRYFPDGGLFSDRKGLLLWSVIILAGSLVSSLVFISLLLLTKLLPESEWGDAVMRFWIGDSVGIFVTMPLFWWLQDERRRRQFLATILRWETLAYSALTLLSLWIAFVPGAQAHFRYFYVLFLPIVWAASRQGLSGAVFCVSTLQLGLLLGGLLQQAPDISLFELQMRAFLLALVGFLIGTTVDEQRRAASDLRNSLRLAAAGEMAGALAHELNQPLTALSAYGSACEQLLARGGSDDSQLREVIRKMIAEAGRAANVMRRLRDFFRTGATQLEKFPLVELIESAARPFREKAAAMQIRFVVGETPAVMVHGDLLQLEVVLRNLLANAFEALDEASGSKSGRVALEALVEDDCRIVIEVTDNGPGLPATLGEQVFEPFRSTKSSGLGLGLAISRAIAEAHGGSLMAIATDYGCFRLTLPIEVRSTPIHG